MNGERKRREIRLCRRENGRGRRDDGVDVEDGGRDEGGEWDTRTRSVAGLRLALPK